MPDTHNRKKKIDSLLKVTARGIALNCLLAIVKGVAGVLGNSFALLADAIESTFDIFTSLVVFLGLRMAQKPPDQNHPYGHGKLETLAALFVSGVLLLTALGIAVQSIHNIFTPHALPESFTLVVLIAVVAVKETLFHRTVKVGARTSSLAVKTDAWHHRSDALTSATAFLGISVALIGGQGYESADGYAALITSLIIGVNSFILAKPALLELIDTAPDPKIIEKVREVATSVPGVEGIGQCRVRKLGLDFLVDIEVLCNAESSVKEGHDLAHFVSDTIREKFRNVTDVFVHIEPSED